jgi:hypothetical protein
MLLDLFFLLLLKRDDAFDPLLPKVRRIVVGRPCVP